MQSVNKGKQVGQDRRQGNIGATDAGGATPSPDDANFPSISSWTAFAKRQWVFPPATAGR